MQGISQLQRSALRRALQQIFIDGTLEVFRNIKHSSDYEERFAISWKSMLCLVGLRTSISLDDLSVQDVKKLLKENEIIPSSKKLTHQHHDLMKKSITKLNQKSIKAGIDSITNFKLLEALRRERIRQFNNPWKYILPEDVGSCYEIMMECEIKITKGKYELIS